MSIRAVKGRWSYLIYLCELIIHIIMVFNVLILTALIQVMYMLIMIKHSGVLTQREVQSKWE